MKISISDNIRLFRKQKSMTQEQLAEALGVSFAAVSKWERGAATPDLCNIVEMADLFGTSVDALLGYGVQSGAAADLEKRIHGLQNKKDFDCASEEAQKALIRYPNDFRIVYRCGEMYQLKGIETGNRADLERAIELLNQAILLLSQNTDPDISEVEIRSEIANCYLSLGRMKEGIELLKKTNVCGIHNALIGMNGAASGELPADQTAEYLTRAFIDCFRSLVLTMSGYMNYFARKEDTESVLEAGLWLIGYLESIRPADGAVSYIDKVLGTLYSECATRALMLGQSEDARRYLHSAYLSAKKFDSAPTYRISGMKFNICDLPNATAYDDYGKTAIDAIERQIGQEDREDTVRVLWEEIKHDEDR
ncbi:MAG: helix-turn-helix domain-containing protein [Eubacteriales bacterium]